MTNTKWLGLLGLAAITFLAGSNGDGCAPAPGQGEACGPNDTCATGLTCEHYYGIAGPSGPEFKTCEYPCSTNADCPADQACTTVADGPGQVCQPTATQSCNLLVDKSCGNDKVCVAQPNATDGTCEDFAHGQSVGAGYSCGGSIGVSCADDLFCKGLPHGHVIGGGGTCTVMNCTDWREEFNDWIGDINHCQTADDCVAVSGTSCGCTRNVVVNKNENVDGFKAFVGQMNDAGCGPITTCDCPPANGYACNNGVCSWNYL